MTKSSIYAYKVKITFIIVIYLLDLPPAIVPPNGGTFPSVKIYIYPLPQWNICNAFIVQNLVTGTRNFKHAYVEQKWLQCYALLFY